MKEALDQIIAFLKSPVSESERIKAESISKSQVQNIVILVLIVPHLLIVILQLISGYAFSASFIYLLFAMLFWLGVGFVLANAIKRYADGVGIKAFDTENAFSIDFDHLHRKRMFAFLTVLF